ncbi:hypothetical protein [Paenibacillus sp. GCM10023250]|uniref:hypothetical protein n=1 Tax=Paenibacillus sp. GCM10023250 TaxID=3252648 RepID=UPI00362094E9
MVMPYEVPPVSEAVRTRDEPFDPLERYAMYPHPFEEDYPFRRREGVKTASAKRATPAGLLDLPAALPRGAGAALRAAAEQAAAWLCDAGELRAALEALTERLTSPPSNRVLLTELGGVLDLEQAAPFGSRVDVRVERDLGPLTDQLRRVAARVNALRELHVRAGGALRPEPMRRIEDALAQPGAEAAGFRRSSAGAWQVDEGELRASFGAPELAESRRCFAGPGGFASALADEIDAWRRRPLSALIDLNGCSFHALAQYGADAAPRSQPGLRGFRVDAAL